MVDLNQLKTDIEALGEKVKELKTSGGDKDAIGAAVAEMLAKKKEYADSNNGIGFDGNPYEEPLSKAQKKAKAKAEKDASADAANPAKQVSGSGCFIIYLICSTLLVRTLLTRFLYS